MSSIGDLQQQVEEFGRQPAELPCATLPEMPDPIVETEHLSDSNLYVISVAHLLSRSGHGTPHDISALHIPLGGSRFRPCLEDLIQFLVQECRFDSQLGWQAHVEAGRERWRRRQVAAVTRDVPDEAARVLAELGYQVTPPSEPPPTSSKALRHW